MTEQPRVDSPLAEAQTLVVQMQAQLQAPAESLDVAALKQHLAQLDTLLKNAALRGEGMDAEQLRAELERAVQDTATFSSVMVHEIRKPMTSIRGYSDMLAQPDLIGPLNDMQKQFADTIRNNVMSMESLVTDISDISKLNSGRIKLDSKMTTFGQIVMDVQKQVEPLIAKFEHQVTWDVPQGLPILTLDARQLAKVMVKLTQNALQYTPPGSSQIAISAERLDGNVLHITITDNGIGLKPEELARLGELFFRADNELVTSQKGYGLGVPIAMQLLKLMGSELEVQSIPGTGSQFGFRLIGMG